MIDRVVIALSLIAAAGVAGMIWMQFNDNPINARRQALDNDLAKAVPQSVEYIINTDVSYEALIADAVNKRALWKELIPPPPPPPPKPVVLKPPDFVRMLNGVVPSRREQIGKGETLKVKIRTPLKPRGDWYSVGDTIKKCNIIRITDVDVLFSHTKDDIEYNHSISRQ